MTAMDAMSAVNIELTGHNNSSRNTERIRLYDQLFYNVLRKQ